jgi:transketolase
MVELKLIPRTAFETILQTDIPTPQKLSLYADCCRANTLLAIKKAGSGHIGSSFSAMDIVVHLYLQTMNTLSAGFDSPDRDIYFSSKGHDAPGLYSVLYALGVISEDKLLHLRRLAGLDGHPDITIPGVEANSGSLGMGIGKARGMAFGKEYFNHQGHVYVLLGDGEMQEGQIYESLLTTANQRKGRLTAIIDRNFFQSDKKTEVISPLGDILAKFKSFDWDVHEIDGHNHHEIGEALGRVKRDAAKPSVILARTVKGKGISFMESSTMISQGNCIYAWHSGAPEDDRYTAGHNEILTRCTKAFEELGLGGLEVIKVTGSTPKSYPAARDSVKAAYGTRLVELAEEIPELVVLDADLSADCAVRDFEEKYPGRFVENGIAEQDMVSMAGGMALNGLIPVVNSFACFLASRANEQIYNNATENTKIIYALHLAGLIPAGPGKSHQSLRDISLFGALPNCEIVQPGSPAETRALLDYFIIKAKGVCAMRLFIGTSPCLIEVPANYTVQPGQGTVLREGTDGILFAYGPVMLHETLKAAEILQNKGISVRVINMPWLNKVDTVWLDEQLEHIHNVLVLEDHAPYGALYDCLLKDRVSCQRALPHVFMQKAVEGIPACGTIDEALKFHELDGVSIANFVVKHFG